MLTPILSRRSVLWRFLKPRWHYAALNLAANTLSALFEGGTFGLLAVALQVLGAGDPGASPLLGAAGPWLTRLIAEHGREPVFLGLVLLAVSAQFLRSGFQFLAEVIAVHLQTRVQVEAYNAIYAKILRMSFPRVSTRKLGDLTSYLNLTEQLQEMVGRIGEMVRTTLMIASYAALLLWISWPMTLIAAGCYGALSRIFRGILRRVIDHSSSLLRTMVGLNERTTEFLQASRLLHSFARQEESVRTVQRLSESGLLHRRKAILWSNAVEPITDTLTMLAAATFLLWGYFAIAVANGAGLPVLLAFLVALYRMTPRLRALHASLAVLTSMVPAANRIGEILAEPEEAGDTRSREPFIRLERKIEFDRVGLQYLPEEPAALTDLTLEIPRGSFVALVGVSGAGKSSVADLLLRLYEPTSGRVRVDGRDLRDFSRASWRERIGVVSQDSFLFHANIRENIAFGRPEASLAEIITAAKAAYAHGFIEKLSGGYETMVGDRGYRLSGGQCQRVALARALLRKPDLLILDEATSALDSESERLIQRALLDQRGIRTLFAIAHRLSTVSHADRIVVLSEGRLAEQGSHAELLAREGIYAKLWCLQSEKGTGISVPIAEEKSA